MSNAVQFCTYCTHDQLLPLLCLVESLYEQNNGPWTLSVYTNDLTVKRVLARIPRPEVTIEWINSNEWSPLQVAAHHRDAFPAHQVVYVAPTVYFFGAPWETHPETSADWYRNDALLYRYQPAKAHTSQAGPVLPDQWIHLDTLPTTPLSSAAIGSIGSQKGPITAVNFNAISFLQSDAIAAGVPPNTPVQNLSLVVLPYIIQVNRAWVWLYGTEAKYDFRGEPRPLRHTDALFCFGSGREMAESRYRSHWVSLHQGWAVHCEQMAASAPVNARWACPAPGHYAEIVESDEREPVIVTAIVSTYNSEEYIEGCMADLINQSLFKRKELEILVLDSASQQNERAEVLKWIQAHPNIRYVRTETREGLYMAWNRGVDLARGRYLTNANTDDRHHPDALEKMARCLDVHPEAGLIYGQTLMTEEPNQSWSQRTPFKLLDPFLATREVLAQTNFIGPQPMWRKSLHQQVGYFDSRYAISADYEMWLRFAEVTQLRKLPEITGLYLLRDDSIENSNRALCLDETRSLVWNWRHWRRKTAAAK